MPTLAPKPDTNQGEFDFLVPYSKPLLRPDEAAKCLGRSVYFVYQMIDEGKLEAHAPQGREKQRYVVTRRSVLALLADTALYEPALYVERVRTLLEHCSAADLSSLGKSITSILAKLPMRP